MVDSEQTWYDVWVSLIPDNLVDRTFLMLQRWGGGLDDEYKDGDVGDGQTGSRAEILEPRGPCERYLHTAISMTTHGTEYGSSEIMDISAA
jgi:hypothetical protein